MLGNVLQQKLIALIAPAGYGKTSLLIDLVHSSTLPVCWYTLDSYDTDAWEFLRYLTAAIRRRFPEALLQTMTLIISHEQIPLQTVVTTFIREFCAIDDELLLCIDDWHCVNDVPIINDIVAQLITRCPNSHVILASRAHPALPNLMLLAARRQVTFIDEIVLRFSDEELAKVISAEGMRMSPAQAAKLHAESEGWISGVLLALQAARGDVDAVCSSGTSISRSVQRFLAEQVFNQQPPHLQQFLCETSLLKVLTADACDAFLGRSDSWATLDMLLAQRLFISESTPGVLRYHALFCEFLQQRLYTTNPARWRELRIRMAARLMEQHQWAPAFDIFVSVGDHASAWQVLRLGGQELYLQGRLETLEHAFALLPSEMLDVALLCLRTRVALDRGRTDEAKQFIQHAAELCGEDPVSEVSHLQAVLKRVSGHYQEAHDLAQQTVRSTNDPLLLCEALRTFGTCQQRLGLPDKAITTLRQALMIAQLHHVTMVVAQVQHELAICYNGIGQFAAAEDACIQAETCWSEIGNIGRRALTRNSQALNQALTGRYREALRTLHGALEDAHNAGIPQYEAAVLSSFGDIYTELMLWERATAAYNEALEAGGTAFIRGHIHIARIGTLVHQQQYAAAGLAIEQLPEATAQQHTIMLLLLRAKLAGAIGDSESGLAYAQKALALSVSSAMLPEQIRAWATCAWLHDQKRPIDDQASADALEQAVKLCDRLGNDTVLVIESRPLRTLIQRLLPQSARARSWLIQQDLFDQIAATVSREGMGSADEPIDGIALALGQSDTSPAATLPAAAAPPANPCQILRARFLGGDNIWVSDRAFSLGHGRPREVLAYLILHPHGATRAQLYRCFWGEHYVFDDSNALSRVIYRLRAALPRGAIVTMSRDMYYLDQSVVSIDCDVEKFYALLNNNPLEQDEQRHIQAAWQAIELYRGPFLPSLDTSWCVQIRNQLERRYRHALRLVAESSEHTGIYQKALELFQQLLTYDTTNIAAHAGAMRCYIALSEPSMAIEQYRLLTRTLNDTLGIELDSASEPERLYRSILAG